MVATQYRVKDLPVQKKILQPAWQRIILLVVLGYESVGCLLGGGMLIAQPDGHLMKLPVDMMHGAFVDFLVPGIILFGLGILNTLAFVSVLRRSAFDWFLAGLALGGLFIWFWVEIAIIRETVWLHAMWGIPVLLGWLVLIPFIASRHDPEMMRKFLLTCGILSSLWYLIINIFVPMQYEGYSLLSQAPSELSAFDAPTRILWIILVAPYPLLFAAFGWGVLQISGGHRKLLIVGGLIIAYCIKDFYWPPMHMREVIAAGGGTLSDTLHIVWATMTVFFMMLMMGFGAAALGKKFRLYTIATFLIFIVFGALTFMESGKLEDNLPTPFMGLWERINIAAFMLWVIVFAAVLLHGSLTGKFQLQSKV